MFKEIQNATGMTVVAQRQVSTRGVRYDGYWYWHPWMSDHIGEMVTLARGPWVERSVLIYEHGGQEPVCAAHAQDFIPLHKEEAKIDPNAERRYFAVSIKHSKYLKGLQPLLLWGHYGKTVDEEPRCYGGYTIDPDRAEVYSIGEFLVHVGAGEGLTRPEPVQPKVGMVKANHKYDTVLVDAEKYRQYLEFI